MKVTHCVCWLLFVCVYLTEARYKLRRPALPPPQPPLSAPPKMMLKKSWPIAHRISMGNTVNIGNNFPPKRLSHKPSHYRIRRPPMFNVLPNVWKNQMPARAPLLNHAVLPQRRPVKEFHSVNKMPEYSPEYRPEAAVLSPTHRGGVDDDKGPIHTIPAPNLSPMDRPYNTDISSDTTHPRPHTTDANYKLNSHGSLLPNFDLVTITTSLAPQRAVTSPTPSQHQYEVTEGNDINQKEYHTVLSTFLPPEFGVTKLSNTATPDVQSNELFLNQHPASTIGIIGPQIQLGQSNIPMQTNLQSSLHVGFPGTAGQTPYLMNQQIPDLHVGHPAPAGPPLSATQLYDILNSFPQKVTEQYPPGQEHILQQQLGQFFQPSGVPGFSQPQMQSFNYDEQDNKEQQHILLGQDYVAGRINADYDVGAASTENQEKVSSIQLNEDVSYIADGPEHAENNIEYENAHIQKSQATYFNKVANNGAISSQFYTTLPSREAAEKLAALAAAGNVNSRLIGHFQRQQQGNMQNDESMPANHKDGDYEVNEQTNEDDHFDQEDEQYRMLSRKPVRYNEQDQQYEKESKPYDRQQHHQRQTSIRADTQPLRIMVPDETDYSNTDQQNFREKENVEVEYEYENDEGDDINSHSNNDFDGEASYEKSAGKFGSRLDLKTPK